MVARRFFDVDGVRSMKMLNDLFLGGSPFRQSRSGFQRESEVKK
jgi:hypothetical protein